MTPQLWTEAAALLAEHKTEDALYDHITAQLRPILAAGDVEGERRWKTIAGMIDQMTAGVAQ